MHHYSRVRNKRGGKFVSFWKKVVACILEFIVYLEWAFVSHLLTAKLDGKIKLLVPTHTMYFFMVLWIYITCSSGLCETLALSKMKKEETLLDTLPCYVKKILEKGRRNPFFVHFLLRDKNKRWVDLKMNLFLQLMHYMANPLYIPYFRCLVFGIWVTLVAWFSFLFSCLAHLFLQIANKD